MRILFAAMGQSVHSARWIDQISNEGWDIHLFDFLEAGVCPEMPNITSYTVHPAPKTLSGKIRSNSTFPFRRGAGFTKRFAPEFVQSYFFRSRIREFVNVYRRVQPDIVHSLEMQNESYPLLEVAERFGGSLPAPWIYSSWGSDIYHFGDFAEHQDRIGRVLRSCDYYIADCERDVALAKSFGFDGEVLGVIPVSGGLDIPASETSSPTPSCRKTIAVKGYQHWAGRALTALDALELCADDLNGYTIALFLAGPEVAERAATLSKKTGLRIDVIEQVSSSEMLSIFENSRIAVALSISDGSPQSMLEAMMMGAFPIQSDTVSTREWISDGENGFLVPPSDAVATADAIKKAVVSDVLVDRAGKINRSIISARADRKKIKPEIVGFYERVATRSSN